MKAWVYRQYGGPEAVQLEDVPKPEPKDDELLVRIHATTVTAADWRALTLDLPRGFGLIGRLIFGVRRPRKPIMGLEMAGVVEAVGARVTRFRPGDEVFASTDKMGCHAQWQTIPENGHVELKPAALSFEEAAALTFGPSTALYFFERAKLRRRERVLVIGASGAVGTSMVQLAKHMGAHVTGATSARNADLVASIGADRVVDYAKEDPLAQTYDVIADTVGETPFARAKPALAEGGRYLAVAGDLWGMVSSPLASMAGSRKAISGVAATNAKVARELAELATKGALRPVIGHRFDFSQMREAHALVMSRRKRGNLVVIVPGPTSPSSDIPRTAGRSG